MVADGAHRRPGRRKKVRPKAGDRKAFDLISTPKILIVDDELPIRRLLRMMLARSLYEVTEAGTAAAGLRAASSVRPDIVLLDLGLPDRDGMELIRIIGEDTGATVLVMSARDATEQKVRALDLGAADYVTKPFDTEELLARVRAALRHRIVAQGAQATVKAGEVEIDLVKRRVLKAGIEVRLTPKEYGVVAELAKFPGRVITHDELLASVWPGEAERHVEYLRVVVRNARLKLESDPARPRIVVNELGVGYRLVESRSPSAG